MFYKQIATVLLATMMTNSSVSAMALDYTDVASIADQELTVTQSATTEEATEDIDDEDDCVTVIDQVADVEENSDDSLVGTSAITGSALSITQFNLYGSDSLSSYQEQFQISADEITSITNNGGCYADSTIDLAIDGDFTTHWETGEPNSDDMTNEVIVTFDEVKTINRLVYAARRDSATGKGFAAEVAIYASTSASGDDFELVGEGTYTAGIDHVVLMSFEPTKMRRVKFVFLECEEDWASASELQFYTQDTIADTVNALFTDQTYSEVKEAYADIEFLNNLASEVKGHPLESELEALVELAIQLVDGEVDLDGRIIEAEQQGDRVAYANEILQFGFGNNNQPTGICAMPGDIITVYVEADESAPLPQLVFTQQEGSDINWQQKVTLQRGVNTLVVPDLPIDDEYVHDVTRGGALYIYNPYTEEEQGSAPIIRIEGGERFPFLTADTDEEEFLEFLTEYKLKVEADVEANPDVADRQVLDVFEFVSDHLVFTGTTTGAYEAYITQGVAPLDTIASYNNYMEMLFAAYGLDGSSTVNDPGYIRENVRLAQPYGAMYAAGDHIGVQEDVMTSLLIPFEVNGSSWGLTHEIGHRLDVEARIYDESTNNMLAQISSAYYGNMDTRIPFESSIYQNVVSDDPPAYEGQDYFERIGVFWQLEMYQEGYWAKLNQFYRERTPELDATDTENSKEQYLVLYSSEILGLDLSEFFERHGFTVNDETKEETSKYKAPSEKIWYLNTDAYQYDGEGFGETTSVTVTKSYSQSEEALTLCFDVDSDMEDRVLGYEVYKDGKVVAFTSTNSYVDEEADLASNETYEVIAYAKDLSTSAGTQITTLEPSIVANDKITVALNETFDALEYANAYDCYGESIDGLKVSDNVDVTKTGSYEVIYQITDNSYTVSKTAEVEVVGGYDYLSDYDWVESSTDWGTIRKNSNITLRINGEVTSFEKGFGIHANGILVYDLSNVSYDKFEAYVGVDQSIAEQSYSSVIYSIYADGVEVYNSGLMNYQTNAKFVSIDIQGVSTLTLKVTDADNGNTSDHGVIAQPRLLSNNRAPELSIPSSESVKLGETVDLAGEYTALDAEDGDLTSQVVVTGEVDFDQAGEYTITYTVTDSDGNVVTKTRTIAVVDMAHFDYLTDYDWTYVDSTYADPNIDMAHCEDAIRLTDESGDEVSYERGLGMHSTSEVIYDLSEMNYDYFSAYVGIDRAMYGSVGSVNFQVYLDGELVYDSGVMYSTDAKKYVEIDINGVSELKLVVTDGNDGDGSDHGDWADTKLYYAK